MEIIATIGLLLPLIFPAPARSATAGLPVDEPEAFEGYTLFAPMQSTTTYLIDNQGRLVHSWESDFTPGLSAYLLENGMLLRTCREWINYGFDAGGSGGCVQLIDWDGTPVRDFVYADENHSSHHDAEYLPNGNILLIAWEKIPTAEALEAGRNPDLLSDDELWPDTLIEVDPEGNIVWQWKIWDHLIQDYDPAKANFGIVSDHPERIDLNFVDGRPGADWTHINSVRYNKGLDQILLSVHGFSEIWVIDHGTTTTEAAGRSGGRYGKGGDLLYRWGNPSAYRTGGTAERRLYKQHDAQWIDSGLPGEGNILVFNNGAGAGGTQGNYSTVVEIVPPVDDNGFYRYRSGSAYEPEEPVWTYIADPPTDFYSQSISGAQRLPNGNTLICEGESGTFFEVTPEGRIVWMYISPVSGGTEGQGRPGPGSRQTVERTEPVFKIRRYAPDYPGLGGRDLTPGMTIEEMQIR